MHAELWYSNGVILTCAGKICKDDGQVDPDCFVACQQLVIDKMEKE